MAEKLVEKIAIYSRKSKFTGKGESIENQIGLCRQYISANYGEYASENIIIYEDEGFSGGNTERPKFKKMMSDAKCKKFTAIVCYRLDRISRNISNFANLIEELNDLHISFVSINEKFDTSLPMGRAMMYIASVFSQLERETIAERIRDNMNELSKTGRWLGGTTPTGYESESIENITIDGKIKKSCKLKLIKEEGDTIVLIFHKFAETHSLSSTETYLLQNGYLTKNKKQFSRFTIKNILTNPVYIIADKFAYDYFIENQVELFSEEYEFDGEHGIMAYNKTLQKPGHTHEKREMTEWVVAVGKHIGLIRSAEWIEIQKILNLNKSKSYRKPRSNFALLSGLLFCGSCGKYMRPKLSKRINSQGERIYYYLCSTKEISKMNKCVIKNVDGNMIDKLVCNEIKKISNNNNEFVNQIMVGKKNISKYINNYDIDIERLKKSLNENENEIHRLVMAISKNSGGLSESYIIKEIDELHKKGVAIKEKIKQIEFMPNIYNMTDINIDFIKFFMISFGYIIDNMDVEQKRAAIKALVEKIVWNGTDIHIYLLGSL